MTFHDLKKTNSETPFSSLVMDYIKSNKIIEEPQMGRFIPLKNKSN
jgi:hypothetical protein